MPGESILVIDGSQAVQDIARNALRDVGYQVTTASNGAAALTYPGIEDIDLVVIDREMAGLSGEETTRILKQHAPTHPIPVLMLVGEEDITARESMEIPAASGYLLKPFDPRCLLKKVEQTLEQRSLDEMARHYLFEATDAMMSALANEQISSAIERKTQLIVERCIQNITTVIDERARAEVDARVTNLLNEKEQELVKLTVREVASSMIEKLATTKVDEAMQTIMRDQTDRAVRRVADQTLPNVIRERVREMLGHMLPKKVAVHLDRAVQEKAPELSQQIIGTIDSLTGKSVPRLARELLPSVIDTQVRSAMDQAMPRRVGDLVAIELREQMARQFEPAVHVATRQINRHVLIFNALLGLLVLCGVGAMAWMTFFGGGS